MSGITGTETRLKVNTPKEHHIRISGQAPRAGRCETADRRRAADHEGSFGKRGLVDAEHAEVQVALVDPAKNWARMDEIYNTFSPPAQGPPAGISERRFPAFRAVAADRLYRVRGLSQEF